MIKSLAILTEKMMATLRGAPDATDTIKRE